MRVCRSNSWMSTKAKSVDWKHVNMLEHKFSFLFANIKCEQLKGQKQRRKKRKTHRRRSRTNRLTERTLQTENMKELSLSLSLRCGSSRKSILFFFKRLHFFLFLLLSAHFQSKTAPCWLNSHITCFTFSGLKERSYSLHLMKFMYFSFSAALYLHSFISHRETSSLTFDLKKERKKERNHMYFVFKVFSRQISSYFVFYNEISY